MKLLLGLAIGAAAGAFVAKVGKAVCGDPDVNKAWNEVKKEFTAQVKAAKGKANDAAKAAKDATS